MSSMKLKTGHDLIYGINCIMEALRAKQRFIHTIYTTKPTPKSWNSIAALLKPTTKILFANKDALTNMAGTPDHQGVVAYAGPFVYRSKFFSPAKEQLLLLLDSVQDPRNLGAILRTAYCTGVQGVIIPTKQAAPLNAVALKASAGLAEHLQIVLAPSSAWAVEELKKAGYTMYATALGGQNACAVAYELPLCVIIGNEGSGINPALLKSAVPIELPQRTKDISYNASVAAGISLFYIATKTGILKS
jgi:23S rRNA (guanosine2251-2'-O)-methyltransferase